VLNANLIAKDKYLDLALLKVDTNNNSYISLSNDAPYKLQKIIAAGYPFGKSLSDDLKLQTHNRLYPPKLYKGVAWQGNTNLFYLGMQDQFHTFNMFDVQAWYVRDIIMNKIFLPSAEEISNDINKWVILEERLSDPIQMIDFQTEYTKDLAVAVDYPMIDFELIRKHFYEWEHDKERDIINYRNKSFTSAVTGTKATIHHTNWLEAMDDTIPETISTASRIWMPVTFGNACPNSSNIAISATSDA
jgi:cation diffusion facilitator CzcD-associated flavoprotein CzcO